MESRKRDGPGDLSFFLDILAVAETTRRLARVAIALAIKAGAPERTPTQAELARRIVTAGIPELLADAQSAGIPADELTTAAIDAWARGWIGMRRRAPCWMGRGITAKTCRSGWWTGRRLPIGSAAIAVAERRSRKVADRVTATIPNRLPRDRRSR